MRTVGDNNMSSGLVETRSTMDWFGFLLRIELVRAPALRKIHLTLAAVFFFFFFFLYEAAGNKSVCL